MFLGTAISLNKCLPLILLSISEAAFFSKRLQMSHICPLRHFALVYLSSTKLGNVIFPALFFFSGLITLRDNPFKKLEVLNKHFIN